MHLAVIAYSVFDRKHTTLNCNSLKSKEWYKKINGIIQILDL